MASLQEIKRGPNYIVYQAGEQKCIKIENVRFSFPYFGSKREDEGEDGSKRLSWQGVAMLAKGTHVAAKDAFKELLNELEAKAKVRIPNEYRCLKNGDDKEDEHMHGHWLISFSEGKTRPSARDERGGLMTEIEEIDAKFYGGCYGSVLLRPWYFDGKAKGKSKTYPKRMCCGFTGVQFLRDGTPFGNRIDDSDAWGPGGADTDPDAGADDDGL